MTEDRRTILEMLAAGRITAEEAERLLAALEQPAAAAAPKAKPKYLHVVVDGDQTRDAKVNVRVPMQLLRAGVRLASFVPAEAQERVDRALKVRGFGFKLSQLKPDQLEELVEQLDDISVDVNDGGRAAKVRVYCE